MKAMIRFGARRLAGLALCLGGAAAAWAGSVSIPGMGGNVSVPVASLPEVRWQTVIHQEYDFSCGSAAVATLLTYHYEHAVSEDKVFQAMFRHGDQRKIHAEGFSMLDMKRYLDSQGLRSDGFRISLDKLARLGVPAIALVNTKGYRHFVVVRGIQGDRVLLADPAVGSVAISRRTFEQIWNGIVLAARSSLQTARSHFNDERDWRGWPQAPISKGVSRTGLGMFTLTIPGRNELGR